MQRLKVNEIWTLEKIELDTRKAKDDEYISLFAFRQVLKAAMRYEQELDAHGLIEEED